MLTTRFTELVGASVPIQQAGMGGVTTPGLAAAVSNAGGLGMLAAAGVPTDYLAGMLEETAAMTRAPFGVNFLIPFLQDPEAVRVAARRARVVEFFYGDPDRSLVEMARAEGALACWQVGSAEEARLAEAAGCDLVVAQGTEAGGHVRGSLSLLTVLPAVLDAVAVPVLAAGGIGTARAAAGALAAGASGVRLGTVFLAAEECGAHPVYVEHILKAGASDTVLTEAFSVMWPNAPHRVLRSCIEAAEAHNGDVVGEDRFGEETIPVPRFAPPPPTVSTTGNIEAMALYAGESVEAVTVVRPAAEILQEIAEGADALLRKW